MSTTWRNKVPVRKSARLCTTSRISRRCVGASCQLSTMGGIAGPFLGSEALTAGLVTRRKLQREFRQVYRNVYLSRDQPMTPVVRARAAWLWSGREATLGGLSAAAMAGAKWIAPEDAADVFRVGDPVEGINIHRDRLTTEEVRVVDGIPTTTPPRTAYDLGRRGTLEHAVMRLDALVERHRAEAFGGKRRDRSAHGCTRRSSASPSRRLDGRRCGVAARNSDEAAPDRCRIPQA